MHCNVPIIFLNSYHLNVKHYAQELLKFKTKGGSVDVRQLLPGPGNDYRCVIKYGNRFFLLSLFETVMNEKSVLTYCKQNKENEII